MSARTAPIVVRPARDHELDAAGDVVVAAYLADDLASERYAGMLRASRERARHALVLVAVDDQGTVHGSITYARGGTPMTNLAGSDPDASELRMLGVPPAARGRGVALALVLECIARARADGAHRIVLSTRTDMLAAQRLYAGLGFTRRPDLDWTPEPDVRLLGMELDLRDSNGG